MPSVIKCNVTDCSYNGNAICSKQDVHVSGSGANRQEDTACKSFAKGGDAINQVQTSTLSSSFGGGIYSGSAATQTSVGCSVTNCTYNTGTSCNKNEISIDSLTAPGSCMRADQTCCHSFREK